MNELGYKVREASCSNEYLRTVAQSVVARPGEDILLTGSTILGNRVAYAAARARERCIQVPVR
jgi:hypothetical protein